MENKDEKLKKLFLELKEWKSKKWNAGTELIKCGDRIRKIENKIDGLLE